MTLVPSTAAGAVYHDALSTARGVRTLCFLVLLLCLVGQIALFLTAKFSDAIPVQGAQAQVTAPTGVDATTGSPDVEGDADVNVTSSSVDTHAAEPWLYAILYLTLFAGMIFSLLLSLTLLFTTLVMLNGRTVGVARAAKAFLLSLLLLLLLMPWQSILNHPTLAGGPFRIPGLLYTWSELDRNAKDFTVADWLGWARFLVWPLIGLILLIVVFAKSGRGIKEALGEDLPDATDDDAALDRPIS